MIHQEAPTCQSCGTAWRWVRTCQECGQTQEGQPPRFDKGLEMYSATWKRYCNQACHECKSPALDYGSFKANCKCVQDDEF